MVNYFKSKILTRHDVARLALSMMHVIHIAVWVFSCFKHKLSQPFPDKHIWCTGVTDVFYFLWANHPSFLTLKKLPLLSVRPQGGLLGGVLEAMLSSCPRGWLTLWSGCVLRYGTASAGAGALWVRKHTSAVVQPEEIPALATASIMRCWSVGMLWLSRLFFSSPPLILLSTHSPLHLLSLFLPPLSPSLLPLAPAQIIALFSPFHLITTLSLFFAWTSVLSLPVYLVSFLSHIFIPYVFFLACPHTYIIHFPSRKASVPAQLPFSPHIVPTSFRAVVLW